MSKYFEYFPNVRYHIDGQDYLVKNISRRAIFRETLEAKPFVFMPYTVVEDDRPEDVSYLYYGTVDYTWLIWLANNIIDPYSDWPMTYSDFTEYMVKKYAEQSGETGYDVLAWTQNETITENIRYYEHEDGTQISPDTFLLSYLDPTFEAADWKAVRIWDQEFAENETKREIELVNRDFASEIVSEFKELMRG